MFLVPPLATWVPAPREPGRGYYSFHAKRALLSLCIVPQPPPAAASEGDGLPSGVVPLGAFGLTVGGGFFVDWDESPRGPYREVGLLSSLVTAAEGGLLADWGGWASHVWVDSSEAAEDGRRLFGLPTAVYAIDVQEEADDNGSVMALNPAPSLHVGDAVGPFGKADSPAGIVVGSLPWDLPAVADSGQGGFELPSLSGLLPDADPADVAAGLDCRQLLKYPLRLRPGAVRLLPGSVPSGGVGIMPRVNFSGWLPLFSIELKDVGIDVGVPEKV